MSAFYSHAGASRQLFGRQSIVRRMAGLFTAVVLGLSVAACGGQDDLQANKPVAPPIQKKIDDKPVGDPSD